MWLQPLMHALTSGDEQVASNAAAYAVPIVLNIDPASMGDLLTAASHLPQVPGRSADDSQASSAALCHLTLSGMSLV